MKRAALRSLSVRALVVAGLSAACAPNGSGRPLSLRSVAPAAYDSARGVTVLFRGRKEGPGETWEWDGTTWSLRSTVGPSSREGHALAYDSARGVTVLFGGFEGSGTASGETWEWDGTTWVQLFPGNNPTPRHGHAMVFDSALGETTLFGGTVPSSSTGFFDATTWQWNGSRWRIPRNSEGPSQRTGHALAYDSARGVTVLFGGQGSGGPIGDTWEWNGTRWSQSGPALEPSPRAQHALAYDSARGVTVLFGGFDGALDDETWEWDGTDWAQRVAGLPARRAAHAMVYDSARGLTFLFGGAGHEDETWEWDGTDWLSTPAPESLPPSFHLRAIGILESGAAGDCEEGGRSSAGWWFDLRAGPEGGAASWEQTFSPVTPRLP